jgi:hypothetical protein
MYLTTRQASTSAAVLDVCTTLIPVFAPAQFKDCKLCTGFWWGNLRERDHWGGPDVDGRIILGWIFRKCEWVVGTGWSWLRVGTGGDTCEYGEKHSDSKNAGNFLTSCRTS